MIIKITPDKEKALSLLEAASDREEISKQLNESKFPSNFLENMYETCRELVSSIMLSDGFRTIGDSAHKEAIEYLKNYKEFKTEEISLLDDLRVKRNKFMYEGKKMTFLYLKTNKSKIKEIIKKLKVIATNKLK